MVSLIFQKVVKKHKTFWKPEDFVLLMAPAGGFEPLAYRLGGKIQPRPTVTYHILMYLFMSIFPCENLYPRVIIVHIA